MLPIVERAARFAGCELDRSSTLDFNGAYHFVLVLAGARGAGGERRPMARLLAEPAVGARTVRYLRRCGWGSQHHRWSESGGRQDLFGKSQDPSRSFLDLQPRARVVEGRRGAPQREYRARVLFPNNFDAGGGARFLNFWRTISTARSAHPSLASHHYISVRASLQAPAPPAFSSLSVSLLPS